MAAKKSKILLVEDEAVLRDALREWLQDEGYEVEVVETGEEALDRIKSEEFGVLVLDLRLPGIDGLRVFETAKELRPATEGVIITAYPSQETLEKAKRLGLLNYLTKPFSIQDLTKIISAVLGEVERKKPQVSGPRWLELGAVSYRLCTHDYQCGSCDLAQNIQDTLGTIAVIGEDEVEKLREKPAGERLCRYASVHFVKKDTPAV